MVNITKLTVYISIHHILRINAFSVCTTDDDCLPSQFCGVREYPINGGSYYQRSDSVLPGDMTVLVYNDTLFNGVIVEHKPVEDHPDVTNDITIFAVVQQSTGNDGYIVAKGLNDQSRDFGVYLRSNEQQVWVPYRTAGGSRDIIIFNDIVVADNTFHSVTAVIDSINNRCILYLDGNVVDTKALKGKPEFNPGVSKSMILNTYTWYIKLFYSIIHYLLEVVQERTGLDSMGQ